MHTHDRTSQQNLTPAEALELLKHGNVRFTENLRAHRDLLEQVNVTADGQYPFAVILSCIDSRASAELIFDQGLGDIFSVRIAGNIVNDDILGSMEFACAMAGAKLVVVLGHTSCGAVKGACDGASAGHLTVLLGKIRPSVQAIRAQGEMDRETFVQRVADHNVERSVAQIRARSAILDELIGDGRVGIVGGMYSLSTGEVTFGELICGTP